jgi:hypothetical protein
MKLEQNPNKVNVSLSQTTPVTSSTGGVVFSEGIILRKVSKFLVGHEEDQLVPIPCLYDVKTGEILIDSLPKDVREEYSKLQENV